MPEMVKKSFIICGITSTLDGSQNTLIKCARELPSLKLPYTEGSEDLFGDEQDEEDDEDDNKDDEDDKEIDEDEAC